MTIEEIAKKLDDCANKKCHKCRFFNKVKYYKIEECQAALIKDMANECRKLVEQMGDDGK